MTTHLPSKNNKYPRCLSIAGSDSSGGAGIQADLKTFMALGCFGMAAITALTAQNTVGVQGIQAVSADFLKLQIQSVIDDIGIDALKIGMLHSPELVEVVAWAIEHYGLQQVVFDPVMVATSGDQLITEETMEVLVKRLFPLVTLITPNLDEAGWLLKQNLKTKKDLTVAVRFLQSMGARNVLIKGGHLPGDELWDVLALASGAHHEFSSSRIPTHNTHGTGCTLSSAIAAYLALGLDLPSAVASSRDFIYQALKHGASVQTGQGHGPLNHGFSPRSMHIQDIADSKERA